MEKLPSGCSLARAPPAPTSPTCSPSLVPPIVARRRRSRAPRIDLSRALHLGNLRRFYVVFTDAMASAGAHRRRVPARRHREPNRLGPAAAPIEGVCVMTTYRFDALVGPIGISASRRLLL